MGKAFWKRTAITYILHSYRTNAEGFKGVHRFFCVDVSPKASPFVWEAEFSFWKAYLSFWRNTVYFTKRYWSIFLLHLENFIIDEKSLLALRSWSCGKCTVGPLFYHKTTFFTPRVYMGHSMRNLHPNIFFRKKYVLSRSIFKNNRYVFFFNMIFEHFEKWIFNISKPEKLIFFSIGYSKKSFRYKKLLSYGEFSHSPKLFKVMYCTS